MSYILIPYYSATGSTELLAMYIAQGVELAGMEARVRKIKPVDREADGLFVTKDDLANCSGLILGSPTRFGQMATAVRAFWDETADIWFSGQLVDKPGAVFTSTSSMHGGQESTLLGMMMPMIHHGMMVVGVPYTVSALERTERGGGPYGPSAVSNSKGNVELTRDEKDICIALGKRVSMLAQAVSQKDS